MDNIFSDLDQGAAYQRAAGDIGRLFVDPTIASDERFHRVKSIIELLAQSQHYETMERLLEGAFRYSGGLYELIADCIESRMSTAPSEIGVTVELQLLPVLLSHGSTIPQHADWLDRIPRLPSGEPVPNLSCILFSWQDLNHGIRKIDALRKIFADCEGDIDGRTFVRRIDEWRDQAAPPAYDHVLSDGRSSRSLRFLVASRRIDQVPWFPRPEDIRIWANASFKALEQPFGIDLHPPRAVAYGLYVGQSTAHYWLIRQLALTAEKQIGHGNVGVFCEEFGDQKSGISLCQRITICDRRDNRTVAEALFRRLLRSDRARWRHSFLQQQADLRKEWDVDMTIAPLVQPGEILSLVPQSRRIGFMFGPSAAFVRAAPDGLPLEPIGGDDEHAQWWDYERQFIATENGGILLAGLSAVLEVSPDQLMWRAAFTLDGRKWRPSLIIGFDAVRTATGDPLEWPPKRETLDSVVTATAYLEARKWIRWSIL